MSEAMDGLTPLDRLRLYAHDSDTFDIDMDDAEAVLEKYDALSDIAERMAAALDNLLAVSERHIFSTECQKEREAARSAISAWKDGR